MSVAPEWRPLERVGNAEEINGESTDSNNTTTVLVLRVPSRCVTVVVMREADR